MSTDRVPLRRDRRSTPITARAIDLFRQMMALEAGSDRWEDDGGTRRENFSTMLALEIELGLAINDDLHPRHPTWATLEAAAKAAA